MGILHVPYVMIVELVILFICVTHYLQTQGLFNDVMYLTLLISFGSFTFTAVVK